MKEKVQAALEQIRPYLQADGGDIELVQVEDDGTVQVKLTGACGGCPFAMMTLQARVQRTLMELVPGVTRVIPAEAEAE